MAGIDYRALLIKYMLHVEMTEGVNFIDQIGLYEQIGITEQEKQELLLLEKEAKKLRFNLF